MSDPLRPLCREKVRYDCALRVLRKLRERLREVDYPLYAYRCQDPRCGGFHLSKAMPPDRVRLKAPCTPSGKATEAA